MATRQARKPAATPAAAAGTPHMIWKGAVSFGLVHVPVRLYPATTHAGVGFELLDRRTFDPIGYRKINKASGEEVAKDDIVRGIEYRKGEYVVLSDEEIHAANVVSTQTVDILAFVDASEISFLYLDTPYFLAPDKGGDKVYALLREALRRAGKIGVANVVMHGKQHLAALVPSGPVLALNTLRWADEVRDPAVLALPPEDAARSGVSAREIDMAIRLVEDMSGAWQPTQYRDTFHDDILALVARKVKAGKTHVLETSEPVGTSDAPDRANVVDLSELLRRSLGARAPTAGQDGEGAPAKADGAAGAAKKAVPPARKRAAKRAAAPSAKPGADPGADPGANGDREGSGTPRQRARRAA
ncbi:MAG: Ku protein [Janthinobacterium lividum]